MNAYSRRQFGKVAEPMLALLHQRKVLTAVARFEMRIAKWSALDTGLKDLATLSVAGQIGCSWCMDYGYYASHSNGTPVEKLEPLATWRDSKVFTPLERQVLAYAEAMTATPPRSPTRWSRGCAPSSTTRRWWS